MHLEYYAQKVDRIISIGYVTSNGTAVQSQKNVRQLTNEVLKSEICLCGKKQH
jgi:hypothetical protein